MGKITEKENKHDHTKYFELGVGGKKGWGKEGRKGGQGKMKLKARNV